MSSTTVRDNTGTRLVARTIHMTDVRNVWRMFKQEATVIIKESNVPVDFNVESSMNEIGLMALNDVITRVEISFHVGNTIVRRYVFRVADEVLQAWGPAPGKPPLALSFPEGTQVRLNVVVRDGCHEEADKLFNQFGWTKGKPLNGGGNASTYGTFVSGSYAWDRAVSINPDLDKGNRK
jgi:hypothetical protein